tara:strand:+ start:524 stop:775 length:252 start_codon:yes stop_codon:yes gene_type:complete
MVEYNEDGTVFIKQKAIKLDVEIGPDYVRIYKGEGSKRIEAVGWTKQEWIEDPTVVNSIFNAIHLADTDPVELLKLISEQASK